MMLGILAQLVLLQHMWNIVLGTTFCNALTKTRGAEMGRVLKVCHRYESVQGLACSPCIKSSTLVVFEFGRPLSSCPNSQTHGRVLFLQLGLARRAQATPSTTRTCPFASEE